MKIPDRRVVSRGRKDSILARRILQKFYDDRIWSRPTRFRADDFRSESDDFSAADLCINCRELAKCGLIKWLPDKQGVPRTGFGRITKDGIRLIESTDDPAAAIGVITKAFRARAKRNRKTKNSASVGKQRHRLPAETADRSSYAISRGLGTWRVIFAGAEVPGIGKNRGMFYVAYLLKHVGTPAIHAIELEAKSLVFLHQECGITEVEDQKTGKVISLDADAVIQELNLGKDDAEIEAGLALQERKALATIETSESEAEKTDALKKVQQIREFRRLRFKAVSNPADKAAKRVRTAIDRLCEGLHQFRGDDKQATQAAHDFADFLVSQIREPSARLWPKGGRSRKGHQAGHFQCLKKEGIEWIVR
jgi:tRNA 2-selenouridine synthase SelU